MYSGILYINIRNVYWDSRNSYRIPLAFLLLQVFLWIPMDSYRMPVGFYLVSRCLYASIGFLQVSSRCLQYSHKIPQGFGEDALQLLENAFRNPVRCFWDCRGTPINCRWMSTGIPEEDIWSQQRRCYFYASANLKVDAESTCCQACLQELCRIL